MASKTCRWHECNQPFTPEDHRQEFCCADCRRRRGGWKAKRGAPLLDMLLQNDVSGLALAKKKLETEIKENTP